MHEFNVALLDPNLSIDKVTSEFRRGRQVQPRQAFGRRAATFRPGEGASALPVRTLDAPSAPVIARPAAPDVWSASSHKLSPEAEAFREALRNGPASSDAQFDQWRKSQRFGRFLQIVLRIALLAPGAVCFALHAPKPVSVALEVSGFAIGWWLRRARKRYIRTVVDWKDPLDGPRD